MDDLEETEETKVKPALTEWANEPSLADLKQNYTDASNDHDAQVSKVDGYLEYMHVTGKAKPKKTPGRSAVSPKLIRKQAEWRYSALSEPFLSTPDLFNTAPVSAEDREGAIQNGLVLNNQFNTKIKKVEFINEYVRTGVDEGTIIARTGWEFEEEEQMQMQPVPVEDPNILQIYSLLQANPTLLPQYPPEIQEGFQLTMQMQQPVIMQEVPVMVTIENKPTVDVCKYTDVIIDPTCEGDLDKANFAIYRFETSMSSLEKDNRYTNLENVNVEGNSALNEPDSSIDEDVTFTFKDKPRKKIIAYEYWGFWDIDNTGMTKPFVATWIGDTLIRMEENPFPDKKLPFVKVQYLPIRKSIYGEPDGALLVENQEIIGAVTRGMIDIMGRSANGQVGSRKDALDTTNKRKYERGEDYQYNQNVSPTDAFYMHTYPEIPNSAGIMLELQNNDAESLTGIKAYQSGISGEALGSTATGVRSALDATSKRELDILRRLSEGLKEIGRKIISMNAEFLSEEEVIRVTNEEHVIVRRDDLAGNFDLELSISTAEADNEKAQELAFMLQTTAQTMGPEFAQLILSDIARLRRMPDLAKRIEDYQPPKDPVAEKLKELEIAKIEAEIAEIQSKTNENYAEAELDKARAAKELAEAGKKQSEKDKTDLDFIEQESGVTQERDLQKQGEQARANMGLEVVKGLIKEKTEKKSKTA